MSFSIDQLDGFKNGYNLRFYNVKDCPKCKGKDTFACFLPESKTFHCEICEYEEEEGKSVNQVKPTRKSLK